MFCYNCGNVLGENAKFCPSCGTKISSVENINLNTNANEKIESSSSTSFASYRNTIPKNTTANNYQSSDSTTSYIAKDVDEEKGDIRSNVRVLTIIASILCPIAGIVLGIIHLCKGKTKPGVVYLVCGIVTAMLFICRIPVPSSNNTGSHTTNSSVSSSNKNSASTSKNDGDNKTVNKTANALYDTCSDYKNMNVGDIAEAGDFYITLDHIKKTDTTQSTFGADEVGAGNEVVILFYEVFNATDAAKHFNRDNITAYADGVEAKEVDSYYKFSEDNVKELGSYELDPHTAALVVVNFEVPKSMGEFKAFYKSDCIWTFDGTSISRNSYDGTRVLGKDYKYDMTELGAKVADNDGLEIVYDGIEIYNYDTWLNGVEHYVVFKYTLTNTSGELFDNSLLGFKMRGYSDNYLLDDATYTMTDKIGNYINIHQVEKIQPSMSTKAYVAFKVNDVVADYAMAFDMGYIVSDMKGMVYATTR